METNNNKIIILFIVIVVILMIGSLVATPYLKKEDNNIAYSEASSTVSKYYKIDNFLKNTIYICYNASLYDYNYTPTQEYRLNAFTVEIDNSIAIVKTDYKVVHKIVSVEYYQIDDWKVAILTTNKGKIKIAESSNECISLYVKYGLYTARAGILPYESEDL